MFNRARPRWRRIGQGILAFLVLLAIVWFAYLSFIPGRYLSFWPDQEREVHLEQLERAQSAYAKGDFPAAARFFGRLKKADLTKDQLTMAGTAALNAEKYAQATKFLKAAYKDVDDRKDKAALLYLLARAALGQKDTAAASSFLKYAIELDAKEAYRRLLGALEHAAPGGQS